MRDRSDENSAVGADAKAERERESERRECNARGIYDIDVKSRYNILFFMLRRYARNHVVFYCVVAAADLCPDSNANLLLLALFRIPARCASIMFYSRFAARGYG